MIDRPLLQESRVPLETLSGFKKRRSKQDIFLQSLFLLIANLTRLKMACSAFGCTIRYKKDSDIQMFR